MEVWNSRPNRLSAVQFGFVLQSFMLCFWYVHSPPYKFTKRKTFIYIGSQGFGISIGAEVFTRITHRQVVGPDDFLCNTAHMSIDPWWQRKPSLWWGVYNICSFFDSLPLNTQIAFLTVPLYSFVLTLRNHAPLFKRETVWIDKNPYYIISVV